MTKKEAKKRKTDWRDALKEGRVIRYNHGERLTSYPTRAAAESALAAAKEAGVPAEVVAASTAA